MATEFSMKEFLMFDPFSDNRLAIVSLVRELKTFTRKELFEEFKRRNPETFRFGVGGGWSFQDYLAHLENCNVIVDDFGDYTLVKG